MFSALLGISFAPFISFDCRILVPLLSPAAKRARWLQLGTDEWYLDEIMNENADPDDKGYVREDVGVISARFYVDTQKQTLSS